MASVEERVEERQPLLQQQQPNDTIGIEVHDNGAANNSRGQPFNVNPSSFFSQRIREYVTKDALIATGIVLLTSIIYFSLEIEGLSEAGIDTLSIFLGMMALVILTSYEMSIIVSLAMIVLVLGKSLECQPEDAAAAVILCRDCHRANGCRPFESGFAMALQGFSMPISWMIFSAFHLGMAIKSSSLGRRISLLLIKTFGSSLIKLGLSIFLAELCTAPFVPSNTARGASILPIVMSIIHTLHPTPTNNPALGKYLILCAAHANLLISSFFVTAAAPNPIVVAAAKKILGIEYSFSTWTLGNLLPGCVCMLILPNLFFLIYKPAYDARSVKEEATKQLEMLGPFTWKEGKLCLILAFALSLWITGDITEIPETFVAFLAFITLLFTETLTWNQVATNSKAWETFYWLSIILVMSDQLSKLGVSAYLGNNTATLISYTTSSPLISVFLLTILYFLSMFLFSSITGHALALIGPFLSASKVLNIPPYLATSLLAYTSSLSACLTPFSTGSVILYFSQGYFTQREWLSIGFLVSFVYFLIYFTIGIGWLKLLDYF